MVNILDVLCYFNNRLPATFKQWRGLILVSMVYLADWRSVIVTGAPITDVQWIMSDDGPAPKIENLDPKLAEGILKLLDVAIMAATALGKQERISAEVRDVLEFVVESVRKKKTLEIIQLINSTYPVLTNSSGSDMNLESAATNYQRVRKSLEL